jgi:hypothetical protein
MSSNLGNEASYTIYNMLGQNVSIGKLTNNKIDVGQLQSGMYFMQIVVDGKKGVKQFIKK